MSKHLIFIGPPASGKGSIAYKLVKEFNYYQLSTGDLLREEVEKGTPLGKEIAKRIDNGMMVDNEITLELMKNNLPKDQRIIFDGYPRNIGQANILNNKLLPAINSSLDEIIPVFFNINLDKLLSRVVNRRTCKKCGKIYHLENFPPKLIDNIPYCISCNIVLDHRKDDSQEAFPTRLETYKKVTLPTLDIYSTHKNFIKLNADQKLDKVYDDLIKYFN